MPKKLPKLSQDPFISRESAKYDRPIASREYLLNFIESLWDDHIVSQVIAASMEAGLIKLDEKVGTSRKFARYLPFWA